MTKSKSAKTNQPRCRLYLTVAALPGEATQARLRAALSSAQIASVLFVPPSHNGDANDSASMSGAKYADTLKPLIALAQQHDAAALLLDDIAMAKSLKADGVHLGALADAASDAGTSAATNQIMDEMSGAMAPCELGRVEEARDALADDMILGAIAGPLRDDAMGLGERSADYVGFALNRLSDDHDVAVRHRLALIQWWAPIFEIPSVAFDVETQAQATELALAGADFIGVTLAVNAAPADAAAQIRAFDQAIGNQPASADQGDM